MAVQISQARRAEICCRTAGSVNNAMPIAARKNGCSGRLMTSMIGSTPVASKPQANRAQQAATFGIGLDHPDQPPETGHQGQRQRHAGEADPDGIVKHQVDGRGEPPRRHHEPGRACHHVLADIVHPHVKAVVQPGPFVEAPGQFVSENRQEQAKQHSGNEHGQRRYRQPVTPSCCWPRQIMPRHRSTPLLTLAAC